MSLPTSGAPSQPGGLVPGPEDVGVSKTERRLGHAANHYPLFDYLRILLAIGVFVQHAFPDGRLPPNLGNACVQVFFALSGFLIGTILLRTKVAGLPRFYFKRVVRIWIPYALAVVFLMTATLLRQDLHDPLLWRTAFYNVTFVTNLFAPAPSLQYRTPMYGSAGHFWSICVEEQFYLLAPLIVVLLPRARLPLLIGLALINVLLPHDFAAVALGVLLAIFATKRALELPLRLSAAVFVVLTLVATYAGSANYASIAPFGAVALVAALARPGGADAFGATLGGMSYPFYLHHWIPLLFRPSIRRVFGVDEVGSVGIALVATLALSAVHYALVDRPVLLARDRWYTPRRGKRAWIAGVSLAAIGLTVGCYFELR